MNEYWLETDLEILNKISTFEEMVAVGLNILRRMSTDASNQQIVQICGPMTTGGCGNLTANMLFFKKAMTIARKNGLYVFDQTPFQDSMLRLSAEHTARSEYCKEILHIFYRQVFMSGFVKQLLFLPGWRDSVGARWEYDEGRLLGLAIADYPEDWIKLIYV